MQHYTSFLWLLPFACFCTGYFTTRGLLSYGVVLVPSLIGKPADTALIMLSEKSLNPRVIGIVDDSDAQAGTVVNQIPQAGSRARPHQTIFVVITSRTPSSVAGDWVGKTRDAIQTLCAASHMEPRFVSLAHTLPVGTCFGQFPTAGMLVEGQPVCYISAGVKTTYIWPSFIGAPAVLAIEALKKQGVDVTIIGEHATAALQTLSRLHITDQRPLPGSFVVAHGMHKPSLHVRLGT